MNAPNPLRYILLTIVEIALLGVLMWIGTLLSSGIHSFIANNLNAAVASVISIPSALMGLQYFDDRDKYRKQIADIDS